MAELVDARLDLDLARTGDDDAFARLVGPLRAGLHAHCYRMLGSTHDADDAVQDALVRAWRALPTFEGRSSLRTWLYSITTRVCLDATRARTRRALPMDLGPASEQAVLGDSPRTDVAWLGLYPEPARPDTTAEDREDLELAFVAALQHLPGNQRAVLLLVDVLGFGPAEIADMMQTSVGSVTSALQRARGAVGRRVPAPGQRQVLRHLGDARLGRLVRAYCAALESGDADALVSLLTEDVTWSMPPLPHWYSGLAAVTEFAVRVPLGSCGAWHRVTTRANGQPALGSYLWDDASGRFQGFGVDVLTLREDRICGVTTFVGPDNLTLLGLPTSLPGPPGAPGPD